MITRIKIVEPPLCDDDTQEFIKPVSKEKTPVYQDVHMPGCTDYEKWTICHQCGKPIFGERCIRCGTKVKK